MEGSDPAVQASGVVSIRVRDELGGFKTNVLDTATLVHLGLARLRAHCASLSGVPEEKLQLLDQNGHLVDEGTLRSPDLKKILVNCNVLSDSDAPRAGAGVLDSETIETAPTTEIYDSMSVDLNFMVALTELIDNSLEASKANQSERTIEIRIDKQARVIEISDNGWGMSDNEIRRFGRLGSSFNKEELQKRQPPRVLDPDERDKYHFTSEFSRFGIGAKSAMFYLGPRVLLTSRVANSLTVSQLTLDKREVQAQQRHFASMETVLANEEELAYGPFTHIQISGVAPGVLEEYASKRSECLRFLAEVYHFFLHGGFKHNPERAGPRNEAFEPVRILLMEMKDGEKTFEVDLCPAAAMQSAEVGTGPDIEHLDNEIRTIHRAFFPASTSSPVAGPSEGDDEWAEQGSERLKWEYTFSVPFTDPMTDRSGVVQATLALVYFPVRRNKEQVPPAPDRSNGPRVHTIWQGRRYMPH